MMSVAFHGGNSQSLSFYDPDDDQPSAPLSQQPIHYGANHFLDGLNSLKSNSGQGSNSGTNNHESKVSVRFVPMT